MLTSKNVLDGILNDSRKITLVLGNDNLKNNLFQELMDELKYYSSMNKGAYLMEFLTINENFTLHSKFNDNNYNVFLNILKSFDLESKLDYKVNLLSNSEKQKVYFALVLSSNNDFILLDEPDNFLATQDIDQMLQVIKDDQHHHYIISSTNNLFKNYADHIVFVD